MANHTVASGDIGTAEITLTASTVDTVTFSSKIDYVEIYTDGAAAVWYTLNGDNPTVGGADCFYLPATQATDLKPVGTMRGSTTSTIKLISAGTPKLRIQRGHAV